MTSPYTAGGGGTHLEARIAASCLVATLCEASIRGLPGEFASSVRSQRAAFGDPLDDLVVDGIASQGRTTQLHLQITNKLTFTENDSKWVDVLRRAWDTFSKAGFDSAFQRVGVGLGTYNAKVDQHYQSVLSWAVHSVDAHHFFERVAEGDYSHQDKRSFVATVKAVLNACAARTLTDDEVWRLLKSFVIIHYDFQSGASSRDAAGAIDRLLGLLPPERRNQATVIWDHLIARAGEMIPAGGGATRSTLVEALTREGYSVGPAPSFWRGLQVLQRESRRALGDIKARMHGLGLHRAEAYQKVREALNGAGRFVQIDGEPGAGKSALLKEIAEECERSGPIFVLKDTRIHPRGWVAHAQVLGVSDDVPALLRELSCAGLPILFIDGIDRITDPAVQLTVNDVLKAIANEEGLSAWRVLVTIREQNLKHLETWLDSDALQKLPLRTITVTPLDELELDIVAKHFPRLRQLLMQSDGPSVILRRPFFLNALLGLSGNAADAQLPATEVELLKLWWEMGGSDRKDFASAQHRRNLLISMASSIAHVPNKPIPIQKFSPEPLDELRSAGVVKDKELGHSVVFAHDIYEEWSLCELLLGQLSNVAELLKQVEEPDALNRPMQLLGTYVLETDTNPDSWKALLNATEDQALRPIWQRTVLTSCLQSTRTTLLLEKLTAYLFENVGERLRKLLLAMTTIEVLPNPLFLNEQLVPDLGPEDRARYARLAARPKSLTWVRFLDWLMPKMAAVPPALIPDLLPAFKTWQDSFAGKEVRHCREIGCISYEWLTEVEDSNHRGRWKRRGTRLDRGLSGTEIEKPIRELFLSSAGDVPKLASEYLRERAARHDDVHMVRDEVLANCQALIIHLPSELVDFMLSAYLEDTSKQRDRFGSMSGYVLDQLGILGHQEFYPASPERIPFLALLRRHEEQGLRLIRGFCNHSIAIWRMAQAGRHGVAPVTPVPIALTLPWGNQTFWGDGQVYLWFRGEWGNDAVESALMALEQWALEQLEYKAPFDEIFRKVIEGSDSVASLGIGVSLCLAHPGVSVACAFPLVTCPYIWEWDIRRLVQDSTPTNEIGAWNTSRALLGALRTLNRRPHRKQDIRSLIPYFLFSGNETLTETFIASVRSFPDRLPLSYEEEKNNPEHIAAMREKMVLFSEQADPRYFKVAMAEDGRNIQIWNDPPSLQKEQYKERQQQHVRVNAYVGLAMWANNSIENDKVDDKFSLDAAVAMAQEWDSPDLFVVSSNDFGESHRAAAIVGAAAVAARHCSPQMWSDERGIWCLDVMQRAAAALAPSDLLVRGAVLLMNPTVYATHGYAALLARGYEVECCQQALLGLTLDPLQGVQIAVFVSAKYYADKWPEFYSILFDLAMHDCVVDHNEIPDFHSLVMDERETKRKLILLERAESYITGHGIPVLPSIPMPWVKLDKPMREVGEDVRGYGRNKTTFLYHIAEKILSHICLEAIFVDSRRRTQFRAFVGELLEWTFQEIVPPFAETRHDHHSNIPFEWVFGFSEWCGRLCVHLTRDEAKDLIIMPIWGQDTDSGLLMLQNVMRSFMIEAFLKPKDISNDLVVLWTEMTEWLFNHPEWQHNRRNHLDREFTHCAFPTLFCVAPDLAPLICLVQPGWPHLHKFLPTLKRAICEFGTNGTLYISVVTFLRRGGFDLLPEPALIWLHGVIVDHKTDQKFWRGNGEITVELLKQLLNEKSDLLSLEHRRVITLIADILVDNGVRGAGFLQQELLRAR